MPDGEGLLRVDNSRGDCTRPMTAIGAKRPTVLRAVLDRFCPKADVQSLTVVVRRRRSFSCAGRDLNVSEVAGLNPERAAFPAHGGDEPPLRRKPQPGM